MKVEWRRVTWYSQTLAVALGLIIFSGAFFLGERVQFAHDLVQLTPEQNGTPIISNVTFTCDAGKTVRAIFRENQVQLLLSDGRNLIVPQAVSADGGRYANDDESFVFWTKGTGAFITEHAATTYKNCVLPAPIPN